MIGYVIKSSKAGKKETNTDLNITDAWSVFGNCNHPNAQECVWMIDAIKHCGSPIWAS